MECVAAFISVVELFTNMIEPWIICGGLGLISGWHFACYRYYKKKWEDIKSEYEVQCAEFSDEHRMVASLKLLYESEKKSNSANRHCIGEYKHLMTSGCRNMKVLERTLPELANIPQGVVIVAGVDTRRSDLYFPIKTFLYNIDDPEDREFAIREAEELIETINKF